MEMYTYPYDFLVILSTNTPVVKLNLFYFLNQFSGLSKIFLGTAFKFHRIKGTFVFYDNLKYLSTKKV